MTTSEEFHPPPSDVEIDLLRDLVQGQRRTNELLDALLNQPTSNQDIVSALAALTADVATISSTLVTFLQDWIQANPPPSNQATTGTVSVRNSQGETSMAITVDSTGQNLVFQFDDDHGDIAAPPTGDGSGLVVTLTSDNAAVATVGSTTAGTDANGNAEYTAPLTFGVDGTFNGGATVANTSGAALLDDDGVTAFVQPATTSVTVAAGQATTGTVTEG